MKLSVAIAALLEATKTEGRSLRTVAGYRSNLRYLLDYLGDQDVANITITDPRRYAVALRDRIHRYVGHPATAVQQGALSTYSV